MLQSKYVWIRALTRQEEVEAADLAEQERGEATDLARRVVRLFQSEFDRRRDSVDGVANPLPEAPWVAVV